jgi:AraC-like DNA-binding protein
MAEPETVPEITFSDNIDKANIVPQLAVSLVEYLHSKGFSDSKILQNTTITKKMLQQEDCLYSFRQMQQLIRNALTLSKTPELGLIIGAQENISSWGLLGYAIMSCKTFGAAVQVGMRYQRAAQTTVLARTHREEGREAFIAVSPHSLGELLPFCVEEQFASAMSVFEAITGKKLAPLEVNLSYKAPPYAQKYEDFFQCPVNFNQSTCSLVRDAKLDDVPLIHSNPATAKLSEKLVKDFILRHKEGDNIVQEVRYRLLRIPGQFPNIEMVAQELGMSQRTLRRNLQQQGVSFSDIYDDVRKGLAIEYLQSSNLTAENIAQLLGFAEQSNFRRAFKRWTGKPPSSYR